MPPEHPEHQYINLITRLLSHGDKRTDRTGVGTRALFGEQMRFNLADGFPLFTTKRVPWKTAFKEMLWMLSGDTNIRPLLEQDVHIWSEWPHQRYVLLTGDDIAIAEFERRVLTDDDFAKKWGDLGPVYGKQWRRWRTEDGREIDQVQGVINQLKHNPAGRRILWDGWNVGELHQMALPPCHKHYQFFVDFERGTLNGALVQRSADAFLGLPFNIANLALVTTLLAEQTGYNPGEVVWFGVDVHLYENHIKQAQQLVTREPRSMPTLEIKRKPASLFDYTIDDFDMQGYDPHPAIKAPVAV